jgi:hypothetical protein
VAALDAAGLYPILTLEVMAPGTYVAGSGPGDWIDPLPDADHAPAFWSSLATAFKNDPAVVFDLYTEPHDISWECLLDGGCTARHQITNTKSVGYRTVGMQALVDTVRATGSRQPLMIGGLAFASDLSQWLVYQPADPLGQIVASAHFYEVLGEQGADGGGKAGWDATLVPIAAQVPLVTGELGEYDCNHDFTDAYMAWADGHGVGYLPWSWNSGGDWTCGGGPTLISDYSGSPTPFGVGVRDHLVALAAAGRDLTPAPPAPAVVKASAHLALARLRAGHGRLRISGTIAPAATGSVRLSPRFARSRTARTIYARAVRGAYSARVPIPAGARAVSVTAAYGGSAKLLPSNAKRTLELRRR